MPIAIACPSCGSRLTAPEKAAGKRVKCPKCAAPLLVPSPPTDDGFEVVDDPPPVAKAVRRPAPRADEGFEVVDDEPPRKPARRRDEDEEDDDRPRAKRKPAKKGGVPVWVWPVAGVPALLLAAAGVYFATRESGGGSGPASGGAKPAAGKPAEPTWGRLDGPDGSFVAYFPGGPPEPSDLRAMIQLQGGDPNAIAPAEKMMAAAGIKLGLWTRQDGGRMYVLQEMTFPPEAAAQMSGPNGLRNFAAGVKSTAAPKGAVMASEADRTLGGKPGKVIVTRGDQTGKAAVVAFTVAGGKAYTLTVFGDVSLTADDPKVKQYLDKFELK